MNKYDFKVEMKPIQVHEGKMIPNRNAVIRKDTGDILGIVGNNYKPIAHKSVIDVFDQIPQIERTKLDVCKRGAVMFAKYGLTGIPKMNKVEVKVGDAVDFGLRVFNSYNSVFGVGFEIIANRLVCSNGLVVPKALARLSMRHFQSTDVQSFSQIIIEKTKSIMPTISIWRNWIQLKPSENTIKRFFEEGKIGKRLTKELFDDCVTEAEKIGVWGVYNRFTRHISHELKVRDESNRELSKRNKEQKLLHRFYNFNWEENYGRKTATFVQ